MALKSHLWSITCLTNLHVGNSGADFSIIDKEVERDPILVNVPVIHASGLKGALREHCEANGMSRGSDAVENIFGSAPGQGENGEAQGADGSAAQGEGSKSAEQSSTKASKATIPGQFKFLQATCLLRPLRIIEGGEKSYVLATTGEIVEGFNTMAEGLGFEGRLELQPVSANGDPKIKIEGGGKYPEQRCDGIENLLNEAGQALIDVCSFENYALPVIARNQLENGISNNLWYEEFVPHKSIFYFFILVPDEEKQEGYYKEFKRTVEDTVAQIGGNASVGYGYCTLREASTGSGCDEEGAGTDA